MRPRVLIPLVLSFALALAAVSLYPRLQNRIRYTHTSFLFRQIQDALRKGPLPKTESDLIAILNRSSLDWNSCRLAGDTVLDGWGQRIALTMRAGDSVLTKAKNSSMLSSEASWFIKLPVL